MYYLIVKSSYLLAVNSISNKIEERLQLTLDSYEQFKDNYNDSKYIIELESIYSKTNKLLETLKLNKNEI